MAHLRHRKARETFEVHEDEMVREDSGGDETQEEDANMREDVTENENGGDLGSEEDEMADSDVEPSVAEDMAKLEQTFKGLAKRFRLLNRIGEGTFSTVYKAEDMMYDHYENEWDDEERDRLPPNYWGSPPLKKHQTHDGQTKQKPKPRYVAIKKIYVTSSPARILNELDLLHDLTGFPAVCPLITAFRDSDQVIAVLPYFEHTDFREYFRNMTTGDMKIYFRSLFSALEAVHAQGILHRDIKPTNFLYEPTKMRGVLVDFGLAEREGYDYKPCLCTQGSTRRHQRLQNSVAVAMGPSTGYPKNDSRPSRRANRAGTRGFRAPEVLFKCTEQTTKIDIWSAGVVLLTILSRRFPFFNSADDIEAMIEIATIFGSKRMKYCAMLHGTMFETNIPTIGTSGFALEKIILWSTCRNDAGKDGPEIPLTEDEHLAVSFLERCLELDPNKRISATEALHHPFLYDEDNDDDRMAALSEDDFPSSQEEQIDLVRS